MTARGWQASEFVERGVSGNRDRRPQLDAMMKDVKRRRFDALVCWKLDRLGRDMRHLINLLDELPALDVGLVTLGEGLDTTTPAGRMAFGIFASVAEFERERLRERTLLGLDRARARGKRLGRPVDPSLRARVTECAGCRFARRPRESAARRRPFRRSGARLRRSTSRGSVRVTLLKRSLSVLPLTRIGAVSARRSHLPTPG